MAKRKQKTYKSIERPYDNFLEREGSSDNPYDQNAEPTASSTASSGSTGASAAGSSGSVEQAYVKSDGNLQDIWIKNFIRSANWKPKSQGFNLDGRTGKAQFMGVYISGELEVTSGGNTTLVASGSTAFAAGPTGAPTFTVTSAGRLTATSALIGGCLVTDSTIGTPTYVSGPLGYGWQVGSDGKAEFQNVSVRGIIRTSVFEKDTISAVNGIVLVSSADVLDSDMTALDASTLTIKGDTTFSDDEVIRIKDGTDDEWLLVTDASSAPTYTVTRDLAADYTADTNPVWKTGTAVVSMGVGTGDKTGFISLDSSSQYSPFIDIYGRNSNTYSDYTLHARTGWLKGITDADVGLNATDTWGIYTDNAYIKGVIVADTGKIGGTAGWTISSGTITSVNTGNTTTLASGGTNAIVAGTTGSPQFKVTHAGVMTATSGAFSGSITASTMTGGTITGATIQTATTGARCVITSSNGYQFYYGATYKGKIIADTTYGIIYDTAGSSHFFRGASVEYAQINNNGLLLPSSHSIFFSSGSTITDAGSELQIDRQTRINGVLYPRLNNTYNLGGFDNTWDDCYFGKVLTTEIEGNNITTEYNPGNSSNDCFWESVGNVRMKLNQDGDLGIDGAYEDGGADFAEMFESHDGEAIPNGTVVTLVGNKIKQAILGDKLIGVVSSNPTIIGNTGGTDAGAEWTGKYLKDDFGNYIMEEVEWWFKKSENNIEKVKGKSMAVATKNLSGWTEELTPPVGAEKKLVMKRKINPEWNESAEYIPRKERPEWSVVGLIGVVRILKGQPVADNWIKLREISEEVEEYLIK